MYKKILVFILIPILLLTACKSTSIDVLNEINNNSNSIISPTVEPSPAKPNKLLTYNVSNTHKTFSTKDLIYFIMTDRFMDADTDNNDFEDVDVSNPKSYHGGDIKGIIQKLDYIDSLGATAIWITPVAKNDPKGYHGYWIDDFYSVDPHLGSMEDLKALVKEAHNKNIKIILDYVVNHTGYNSSISKDSKKADWFHPKKDITNWNNEEQLVNGWIYGLPDFNQDNPEVKDFLIQNALWWIEQTGIDGMRLDTVRHVSKGFWKEFAKSIKDKYPDFFLLGEVWDENPTFLEQFHQLGLDGMTDYPLFSGIRTAFSRYGKTNTLINAIKKRTVYSNPELNGIFVDNHDTQRLISFAGENGTQYLKQALSFVMTYPSIPIIYYGTEIGLEGRDDPDNRRNIKWDINSDSDIFSFYKTLVNLRSNNSVVTDGDFTLLDYDSYYFSYMRNYSDKSVVVLFNIQNKNKTVTVDLPKTQTTFKDIFTTKIYDTQDNKLEITLKPLDVVILESL